MAASAVLAFLFFALAAHTRLQRLPPPMGVENVEQLVYGWMKAAGYSLERLDADDMHFAFAVGGKSVEVQGITLVVGRAKNRARFVSVAGTHKLYAPRATDKYPLQMLSPEKAQALVYEVQFDMDRLGLDHDAFFVWTEKFRVHRDLLITDALSEDRLVKTIQDVKQAMFLIQGRLQERLYGGPGIW